MCLALRFIETVMAVRLHLMATLLYRQDHSIDLFTMSFLIINQVLGLIRDIPEIEGNVSEKLVRYTEQLSYLLGERWPVATSGLELTTLFKFFDSMRILCFMLMIFKLSHYFYSLKHLKFF